LNKIQIEMRGVFAQLFRCQAPEVLLEGPAGTGKSTAWLMRLHKIAEKYPACRLLICRKTRASLSESGLVTFERSILPARHPARKGPKRNSRTSYSYPNGSEIVVSGVDNPAKILSTEFDLIYVQEATELEEEDWEVLATRLRNGRLPFQQIGGDCNPGRPLHWLNRRCDDGRTVRLVSRHEDNPWLFSAGDWTPWGRAYLSTLEGLSGVRRTRFFEGRWAAAEGLIYDEFDRRTHVVSPFPIPADWRRVWVVDFGFMNPFVWQDWAISPSDEAYLVREYYRSERTVIDHVEALRDMDLPRPEAVVCDHSYDGRDALERILGVRTIRARKEVDLGIQAVQRRLRGRLFVFADACRDRDPILVENRRPCSSLEEVGGYRWDPHSDRDRPIKEDDHGMDCWRYLAMYLDGTSAKMRVARSFRG
jgi:phage terminase large subunit